MVISLKLFSPSWTLLFTLGYLLEIKKCGLSHSLIKVFLAAALAIHSSVLNWKVFYHCSITFYHEQFLRSWLDFTLQIDTLYDFSQVLIMSKPHEPTCQLLALSVKRVSEIQICTAQPVTRKRSSKVFTNDGFWFSLAKLMLLQPRVTWHGMPLSCQTYRIRSFHPLHGKYKDPRDAQSFNNVLHLDIWLINKEL